VLKDDIDDTIFIIANPLVDTALINLNPKLRKLYLYLLSPYPNQKPINLPLFLIIYHIFPLDCYISCSLYSHKQGRAFFTTPENLEYVLLDFVSRRKKLI